MIVVYPCLVSQTVPSDILPAITKMLERYLITYYMDQHFHNATKKTKKQVLDSFRNLQEDFSLADFKKSQYINEAGGPTPPPTSQQHQDALLKIAALQQQIQRNERRIRDLHDDLKNIPDDQHQKDMDLQIKNLNVEVARDKQKLEREKHEADLKRKKEEDAIENQKFDIKTHTMTNDLVLEPTTILVKTGTGDLFIGIKVIPFYVSSESPLVNLLVSDRQTPKLASKLISITRTIKRGLWKMFYRAMRRVPFGPEKPSTLTGDPMTDIIIGRTEFAGRVIAIIDKNDIEDNEFFQSAGGIKKLFKMGWNNIVFMDDINKRGTFCMKKFNGLCNNISFSTLYSSLQKETLYNSIESARAASSPFFRNKINPNRLFGESTSLAVEKRNEYRSILEEDVLYESALDNIFEKLDIVKIVSKLKDFSKNMDVDSFVSYAHGKGMKETDPEKLKKYGMAKHPEFEKAYNLSHKVLSNSLDYNPTVIKGLSLCITGISILSSIKNGTAVLIETKNKLKDIVNKIQIDPENVKHVSRVIIAGFVLLIVKIIATSPVAAYVALVTIIGLIISALILVITAWTLGSKGKD